MKITFFLTITLLITLSIFAQKDAGVKTLLDKNGAIQFPIAVNSITKKLNTTPTITNDELADGDVYAWELKSGLSIHTLVNKEGVKKAEDISMASKSKKKLTGLPYDLAFYITTLQQCKTKFKAYSPKTTNLYDAEPDGKHSGYRMTFKRGSRYFFLVFDGDKLASMTIASYNIDAAN